MYKKKKTFFDWNLWVDCVTLFNFFFNLNANILILFVYQCTYVHTNSTKGEIAILCFYFPPLVLSIQSECYGSRDRQFLVLFFFLFLVYNSNYSLIIHTYYIPLSRNIHIHIPSTGFSVCASAFSFTSVLPFPSSKSVIGCHDIDSKSFGLVYVSSIF